HLLLTEGDFVAWQVGVRRLIHDRRRRSGCAAGQRKRNSGSTDRRQGDFPPLSLGASLRLRHGRALLYFPVVLPSPSASKVLGASREAEYLSKNSNSRISKRVLKKLMTVAKGSCCFENHMAWDANC